MNKIALCRIDSRLVHGQVVTKWVNQVKANKLVVVNNDLVNDSFLMSIYEMSAPPGMKLNVFAEDQAVEKLNEMDDSSRVLLIFGDIKSLIRVFDSGLNLSDVQVGGLGGGPNRKAVYHNITLDQSDFDSLSYLTEKGVNIIFQTIPEDKPVSFEEIKRKF